MVPEKSTWGKKLVHREEYIPVKLGFDLVDEVGVQLLFQVGGWWVGGGRVGGWSDETKLILNSTLVKVEVEV